MSPLAAANSLPNRLPLNSTPIARCAAVCECSDVGPAHSVAIRENGTHAAEARGCVSASIQREIQFCFVLVNIVLIFKENKE